MAMIDTEINALADKLALPHPEDLAITPAQVFQKLNLPTPGEIVRRVRGDVMGKIDHVKGKISGGGLF
jgi:hypothetical protein